MATYTSGVENTIVKTCQFCCRTEQHRILPEQVMYENPDTYSACVQCEKKMSAEEKQELFRITPQTLYWYPETFNRNDHLVRYWDDSTDMKSMRTSNVALPDLVIFRIFLMLTVVCRTTMDLILTCMKFMKAMEDIIPPTSFIAHLRANAPKHHKKFHDFMMYLKHSNVGGQTIPECFGQVCCVSTIHNPQLERIEDPENGWYRAGSTSIGVCACSHQTMWNIDFPDYSVLGEDGCYSIGSIVDSNNPDGHGRHETLMCAKRFILNLEYEYREQFMRDLHKKLSVTLDS